MSGADGSMGVSGGLEPAGRASRKAFSSAAARPPNPGQQATADAIGLGEIPDHYHVGLRTVVNKETQRLTNVVTRDAAVSAAASRP